MFANINVISCNFSYLPLNNSKPIEETHNYKPILSSSISNSSVLKSQNAITPISLFHRRLSLRVCCSLLENPKSDKDPDLDNEVEVEVEVNEGRDWTTSILLFLLWSALMYYVTNLSPNQTPSTDMYILKNLLNLTGDDGFRMNQILVSVWYIMGLWPLVYIMLLLPTGRSSQSKIPLWPFLILSCFGGAYVLLPYFVFWRPPPPPIEENELKQWPLNFLNSKVTAAISLAAGVGLTLYAGLATGDWKEYFLYFRSSRFIHVMSLDFALLSAFAPFWVYNDMTARKCDDRGSWMLPLSLVPFLGPALYILLRPSLSERPNSLRPLQSKQK